ncbi:MAG: FG-GAP-like repeat-containing protein, partial [Acidobacteriota bacterium]
MGGTISPFHPFISFPSTLLLNVASFSNVCQDKDADGYGLPGDPACPRGAAPDCDDTDSTRSPGTPEQCDGLDNDCDDKIDDGFDLDGDGVTTCGGDCDDANAAVLPGAADICNGLDDDCDGLVDENPDAADSCDDSIPCTLDTCSPDLRCVSTEVSCTSLAPGEVLFEQAVIQVGSSLGRMALGDLDGDGQDDLAGFGSRQQGTTAGQDINILLRQADGRFARPLRFPVPAAPITLKLGDFNEDGALDLVGPTGRSNSLLIFPGRGDGTFQTAMPVSDVLGPIDLAVEDFDVDGHLDLAVLNSTSQDISLFHGEGTGLFSPAGRLHVGRLPFSLIDGDFTGDGLSDLVSTNFSSLDTFLFVNQGEGRFAPGEPVADTLFPLMAVDLNRDSRLDLAGIAGDKIVTLLGTKGGSLAPPATSETILPSHANLMTASDFNGDGHPDLAIGLDGLVAILLGEGDGTFSRGEIVPVGFRSISLFAPDLDDDGRNDLVMSNLFGDVSFVLGRGDGTFQFHPQLDISEPAGDPILSDLNGDGLGDLVVVNRADSASPEIPSDVSIFLGQGHGTFSPKSRLPVGVNPSSITPADFNGDGHQDFAVTNVGLNADLNGDLSILLGNGDGTFQAQMRVGAGDHPALAVSGDFNADGLEDLTVFHEDQSGSFIMLQGNGDGTFVSQNLGNVHRHDLTHLRAIDRGDFNGDGLHDVVLANDENLELLLGRGDGTLEPPRFVGFHNRHIMSIRTFDLDKDSMDDLAFSGSRSAVAVIFGQGDGSFGPPSFYGLGRSSLSVGVADFNDDSLPDLAAVGEDRRLSIFLGDGSGTFSPSLRFDSGISSRGLAIGDLDGDGRTDVVVLNDSPGRMTLL